MAGLPLFARYSQKENLTDRLRGILDDYPPGLGPWKEVRLSMHSAASAVGSVAYGTVYR